MSEPTPSLAPVIQWSWSAPPPEAVTVSLAMPETGVVVASQLEPDLSQGLRANIIALNLPTAAPAVVSLPLSGLRIKITSYRFPEPSGALTRNKSEPEYHALPPATIPVPAAVAGKGASAASDPAPVAALSTTQTRLKPPSDIVKTADRLYYVLQPPLETLIADSSLDFPFVPFPYQFEGVAFLYPRVAALLADEMGLGKTMQAITAIRLLLHAGEVRSVLLVCPKPLVTNWQREFALWAPELPLAIIEGEQTKRLWQWRLPDAPVRIANYELLNRDRQILANEDLKFDLVVLDESQRIKNRCGTTSQVVKSIARTRSWALTGTPVENSPEDLVGIFDFIAPGHLTSDMKPRSLGRAASQYVLRRTKDKVLTELPPKLFRDADLELTPEQRHTYQMAEEEGILRLTEMGDEATIHHVFELIVRLKQICNFDPATGESSKLERLAADLEEVVASGRKAIVFSQWVDTLTTLSKRLRRFGMLEYHGQIPSKKRDQVIAQFRDDPKRHVIVMSYGAGGVGLNLQFAGYVFLFDRWWNPAVEDQAINRAHRIGAAGPVTVSRFLMLDTIEQRIQQILEEKRELFDTIFSDSQAQAHPGLTQQELFGLFKLRSPHGPINLAA